ncbi:hypothetical protein ACJMK2_015179 [Sinanodonta woodiana]|uniref:Uncharacterized protein n=1 Tax=Sinanodonta woodiana TaxID=1069815 RepID=A0ABD3V638_SINWO
MRGCHVTVKSIVDFDTHRSLINKTVLDNPDWNIDLQAGLHSIKLYNTKSMKPHSRDKKLIYPKVASGGGADLLCCPNDIQPDYIAIADSSDEGALSAIIERTSIPDDDLKKYQQR